MKTILVVSDTQIERNKLQSFASPEHQILVAPDCASARSFLEGDTVDLVISAVTLRDGNWCSLLRSVIERGVPANRFRVSCTLNDDSVLAREVRSRGASLAPSFEGGAFQAA